MIENPTYAISIDEVNALLHSSSHLGDVELAERCMRELPKRGLVPNIVTFNTVINTCAVRGDSDCAVEWMTRLQDAGFEPNDVTFATVCKAFSRRGDPFAIKAIMKELAVSGVPLNEYYYASLISACGNRTPPSLALAEEAFLDLVGNGLKGQSVKKVLVRVLGEKRALELMSSTNVSNDTCDLISMSAVNAAKNARAPASVKRSVAIGGSAKLKEDTQPAGLLQTEIASPPGLLFQ
eukprot:TRINITY_DN25545_c0_g1_i2.p1 TRINITY_DN25545_c0_g1~~TRINITY_DN25545_c0_g1_i2.p1  ORF type:complete len:237 (-),score=30.85 TRINITY_DN25545_c0_g1_i2:170-880(-)